LAARKGYFFIISDQLQPMSKLTSLLKLIVVQFSVEDMADAKQLISSSSVQLSSLSPQVQEQAKRMTGWVFIQHESPGLSLQCPAFVGPTVILPSISALDRNFFSWLLET